MKQRKLSKENLLKRLGKTFDSKILREEAINIVKDYDINELEKVVNRAEMYKIDIPRNKKDLDFEDFKKFPKEVQDKVISVLGAYNECNVLFEFGRWDISPDTCIKSYYHTDYRVFGTFYFESLVDKVAAVKKARKEFDDWNEKYRPDYSW